MAGNRGAILALPICVYYLCPVVQTQQQEALTLHEQLPSNMSKTAWVPGD